MRNEKRLRVNILQKTDFVLLLLLAVVFYASYQFLFRQEVPIQYLCSALLQTAGGFYCILIAAYSFLYSRFADDEKRISAPSALSEEEQERFNILELANNLNMVKKKTYHNDILKISILCLLTIISCLLSINLSRLEQSLAISLSFPAAISLFIIYFLKIIVFTTRITAPDEEERIQAFYLNSLESQVKKPVSAISKIEPDHSSEQREIEKASLFNDFVYYYNQLESMISRFATKTDHNNFRQYFSMFESLDFLKKSGLINPSLLEEINAIRKYRNSIMHSDPYKFQNEMTFKIKDLVSRVENALANKSNRNL